MLRQTADAPLPVEPHGFRVEYSGRSRIKDHNPARKRQGRLLLRSQGVHIPIWIILKPEREFGQSSNWLSLTKVMKPQSQVSNRKPQKDVLVVLGGNFLID